MSAPRLLLLGPNGQVGWELRRALAPLGELIALDRHGHKGLNGDLSAPGKLAQTIYTLKPDAVVNAAAYTAVDRAEQEPDTARRINAHGPRALAEACRETDSLLVHYSTDYVFDGSGTAPWREDDPTDPLNLYGKTKLAGEIALRAASCRHLIFRTSWVYAARGRNFLRTMLRIAAERDALQVVDDQHGAPTSAELIADVTAQALRTALADPTLDGTYHLTARGETTWHGYARHLITVAREAGYPIRVSDDALTPVPSEAFPTPAARPHNSRLDVSKLEQTFGLWMPPWEIGVERVVGELVTGDG
ncbi:MAG: dTDP-4-dehydrorhamnose reductase [Spiribacter salinus]|uniref:dTDP-4-dehydrorhamnose reductase n=1 Tax=Spiribacter salinus TaxID=1335746 RepID=A0A540VQN5_9GAMM|nr:MAG: dTDP-4-dehydrorhamnose reductase [Spiribacter salinus]